MDVTPDGKTAFYQQPTPCRVMLGLSIPTACIARQEEDQGGSGERGGSDARPPPVHRVRDQHDVSVRPPRKTIADS